MMVGERLEDRLLFYVLVVDGYDKIGRGFATIDIKDRRIYFCKTNKSIVGAYFLNFNAQKIITFIIINIYIINLT